MRSFCSIVEVFLLAMLDAGHDVFLGGSIAGQFTGDEHV